MEFIFLWWYEINLHPFLWLSYFNLDTFARGYWEKETFKHRHWMPTHAPVFLMRNINGKQPPIRDTSKSWRMAEAWGLQITVSHNEEVRVAKQRKDRTVGERQNTVTYDSKKILLHICIQSITEGLEIIPVNIDKFIPQYTRGGWR